jgi:hypothetical protein
MRAKILRVMKERKRSGALESQADFLVGAMQMYLTLKPESEEDGSWCPPVWAIGILQGRDFLEEEK